MDGRSQEFGRWSTVIARPRLFIPSFFGVFPFVTGFWPVHAVLVGSSVSSLWYLPNNARLMFWTYVYSTGQRSTCTACNCLACTHDLELLHISERKA
jgi:hypothetical protein